MTDHKSDKFFTERMIPVARKVREQNKKLGVLDSSKTSTYYVRHSGSPLFTTLDETVAARLKDHWMDEGLGELTELIEPFMELVNSEDKEFDCHISPLIYQVF